MLGNYHNIILFTKFAKEGNLSTNLTEFCRQTVNGTVTYTFDSPKKVRGELNDKNNNDFFDGLR